MSEEEDEEKEKKSWKITHGNCQNHVEGLWNYTCWKICLDVSGQNNLHIEISCLGYYVRPKKKEIVEKQESRNCLKTKELQTGCGHWCNKLFMKHGCVVHDARYLGATK